MSEKKQTNFLVQGSILAIASIISRIIGLIYRIPMTNIIGDIGNGYYSCAFEIYNVMLIISSYSLPLAVSKLVSGSVARGKKKRAYYIFKGALVFAVIAGTIVALIVYFGASLWTGLLKTPYSVFALKILAPALVVVAILGVIRGFFQGLGTMVPSAVSQVIEQIVNAIVSIWAAYVLFQQGVRLGAVLGDEEHYGPAYGAAGGTLGTSLGAVAALVFMTILLLMYMKIFRRQMNRDRRSKKESFGSIMGLLIATIIPVLLSTTIYNISGIVDQFIFKNIALGQGYGEKMVDTWWGVFAGKYKLMINVPISIASSIAASSVPALIRSYSSKDMDGVRLQINSSMRFIMVIAFPCTVGLMVLAKPIFSLLFPGTIDTVDMASTMMLVGAPAIIFYSISTLSNGLLQGINKLRVPVVNAAIALFAHVLLLVFLMMTFRLNIYAVILANTFFSFMVCVLNARAIARYSKHKQEVIKTFLIPLLCSCIMGGVCFGVYKLLDALTHLLPLSLFVSILVAVLVYAVSIIWMKGLTEEELRRFPKGTALIALAKKFHLM